VYVAALLLGLVLRNPGESLWWAATFVPFVIYCFARPGGLAIFGIATMPGCLTLFAQELLGAPRWVGIALVPLALWMAWSEDQQEHAMDEPSAGAVASTS
jgi:hypothetical protein